MTKTTEKRLVQMPAVEHIKSIKQKLREAKSKYEHNTGASKPLIAIMIIKKKYIINYLKKKNCQLWQYQHYKICLIQN